jgi:hypothetical protein
VLPLPRGPLVPFDPPEVARCFERIPAADPERRRAAQVPVRYVVRTLTSPKGARVVVRIPVYGAPEQMPDYRLPEQVRRARGAIHKLARRR